MDQLIAHVKQLTNKQNLHTREVQWLSQLFSHIQQTINLDLLDPVIPVVQICQKIVEILHSEHIVKQTGYEAESNSKNFVLPVDAILISISEIRSHATAYCSKLGNLWHENFYNYLSPSESTTPSHDKLLVDSSQHFSGDDIDFGTLKEVLRVKRLPFKPYLLIAHFAIMTGPAGLPLLSLKDSTGEV